MFRKTKNLSNKNNFNKKLIVMIPAYNESKTIEKVIKDIPKKIEGVSEVKILVIDDGSKDNTFDIAKSAGADFVIKNKKNLGLGLTFKRGMLKALELGADIIVNIDADGQFNPQDIPRLINPIQKEEADMVTCSRFLNPNLTKDMPWIKKWGNRKFTKLVNRISKSRFTDTQCGFRAYSREAALNLNLHGKFTYTQEVFLDLVKKGMTIKEIPLEVKYFKNRNSYISGRLLRYGLKSIGIISRVTRDSQPLLFFGLPGVIILFLGFIGLGFSTIYWLIHHITTPVRTLISVSIFLISFGLMLSIFALISDMLKTIISNQEEILYRLKKIKFERRI